MKILSLTVAIIFAMIFVPTAFAHEPEFEAKSSQEILKLCDFFYEEYQVIGSENFKDHHKRFLNALICPILYEHIAWESNHPQKDVVLISEIEKKLDENSNYLKNKHLNQSTIPKEIKNQVNLWMMGEIKDKEFFDIVKEVNDSKLTKTDMLDNILLIEESQTIIPKWFKQSTKWYIDKTISEEEFLNSIKYLKEL